MNNFKSAFFFLRLPMAMSLLGHGLVRLPKLTDFAQGMVKSMEQSFLPESFIMVFGFLLPFVEAVLGLALIVGFKIRYTLYGSLFLMTILIFGSSSVENWAAVQSQLVHSIYLGFLLWYCDSYGVKKDN